MVNQWKYCDGEKLYYTEELHHYADNKSLFIIKDKNHSVFICYLRGHYFDGCTFQDDYSVRNIRNGRIIPDNTIIAYKRHKNRWASKIRKNKKLKKKALMKIFYYNSNRIEEMYEEMYNGQ